MASLATWFTPSLQTFSRSAGRSAVLAAAYRACVKLTDERLGITQDYTPKGKTGLAGNIFIGIPNDDIEKLWNDAEKAENRANSTVARELMLPLSAEWNDNERRACVGDIGQHLHDTYGVAVMASIHYPTKDNNNHHGHFLFTTRSVDADGVFGKKTRILDDLKTGEIKRMREAVCAIVNTHARTNGNDWYVYAGKFSDIIQDHIPTTHISITHGKNQRKYIERNRAEVKESFSAISKDSRRISAIDDELLALQKTFAAQQAETDSSNALILELARLNPEFAEKSKDLVAAVQAEQDANSAIKNTLANAFATPPAETKKHRALRLHKVWAEYEHHETQMGLCKDAIAYQRRKIEALKDNPPGFFEFDEKAKHKKDLWRAHTTIFGLEAVYAKSKAYRADKQVMALQSEFCANLEFQKIVKDCAEQIPKFSGLNAALKDELNNNPSLVKEAQALVYGDSYSL